MPNFKAEYTLEMVLDLIEADLQQQGFNMQPGQLEFHLVDFNKSTLQLDISKRPANVAEMAVSIHTPLELSAPAEPEPKGKRGPYKPKDPNQPLSEKEIARRAKIGQIVRERRAREKAAKEAAKAALVPIPVPVQEPETEPEPLTIPQDDRELRDPADYLVPEEKRFYRKVEQTERQQIFEQRMKELNGGVEVVAPAPATFPRSR